MFATISGSTPLASSIGAIKSPTPSPSHEDAKAEINDPNTRITTLFGVHYNSPSSKVYSAATLASWPFFR